jgi:transcription-repair coupling factor (superfamily II helicase)
LLIDLLRPYGLTPRVVSGWTNSSRPASARHHRGAPGSGLTLPAAGLTIIAEEQLFGERAQQERRRRRADRDPARIIQQLADLRPGAPVVHEDYGIGRYRVW